MKQNTFIIGGESKFAQKFIERLNKRLGSDLQLSIHSHKAWNQCGDRRDSIPSGVDLVLVMKTNCNHSLRNWARKKASDSNIKFIETAHKVAVAEMEIRHCYQIFSNVSMEVEAEELDLYDTWEQWIDDKLFILPLWGMPDEGLFNGVDAYERMPWSQKGKKGMIAKWDKLWVKFAKLSNQSVRETLRLMELMEGRNRKTGPLQPFREWNGDKSPYFKLISIFKSFKEDSLGKAQVRQWADQWLKDAYLGTNFKDFTTTSNINYALGLIFGVKLDEMSDEIKDVISEQFRKPGRPKNKNKYDKFGNVIDRVEPEAIETDRVETESVEIESVEIEPVETEPVETEPVETEPVEIEPVEIEEIREEITDLAILGELEIKVHQAPIIIDELHLNLSKIHIKGNLHLSVDRIENNVLYGVVIRKAK